MYFLTMFSLIVAVAQISTHASVDMALLKRNKRNIPYFESIDNVKDSDGDPVLDGKVKTPIFFFYNDDFDTPPVYIDKDHKPTIKTPTRIREEKPHSSCNYDPKELIKEVKIKKEGKRVSEIMCEQYMWEYKYEILEHNRKLKECQDNTPNGSGVINGKKVIPGDFPHMGAVGWRRAANSSEYVYMCGSSLISPKYALTAAHCNYKTVYLDDHSLPSFDKPEVVLFGDVYIGPNGDPDLLDKIIIPIREIIRHSDHKFSHKTYYDVALIVLDQEVPISVNVRPACLYTSDTTVSVANVTGWGKTENALSSYDLMYAEVDIISRSLCEAAYADTRKWKELYSHMFCAGNTNKTGDTCKGDSGGPLQIQKRLPNHIDESGLMYYVAGVTSAGKSCGYGKSQGLYNNVSDTTILCFIERTVWPEETNTVC